MEELFNQKKQWCYIIIFINWYTINDIKNNTGTYTNVGNIGNFRFCWQTVENVPYQPKYPTMYQSISSTLSQMQYVLKLLRISSKYLDTCPTLHLLVSQLSQRHGEMA